MVDGDGPDDQGNNSYYVECLLSEGWIERDGEQNLMYLIKWDGYEWHECTWEPPENLEGTNFLQRWAQERQQMGETAFQERNAENVAKYQASIRRFEEAASNHNSNEKDQDFRTALDDEEKGKEAPLALQKQRIDQQSTSTKEMPAGLDVRDPSPLDSLFQDSQELQPSNFESHCTEAEGGLFVEQPPTPRKPPFHESGSSSSGEEEDTTCDVAMTDASLPDKRHAKAQISSRKSVDLATLPEESTDSRNLAQSRSKSAKDLSSALKFIKASEKRVPIAKGTNEVSKPKYPSNNGTDRHKEYGPQTQKSTAHVEKNSRLSESIPQTTTSTSQNNNAGQTTVTIVDSSKPSNSNISYNVTHPKSIASSSNLTAQAGIETASRSLPGTRIINQPKPKTRQWHNGDTPFSTLHARHVANLRSRAEGTPDIGVLEFPGGSPVGLPKAKGRTQIDNPYARREIGAYRPQEEDMNDNQIQKSSNAELSLESWEADKIPMVCYDHRSGNNCHYGARKCRFMHRNKDPQGKDYPVADASGRIPPKYRTPSITCPFWLKAHCFKSNEECIYAHENTGYMPNPDNREDYVQITPELIQKLENRPQVKGKNLPRSELTCWFWKNTTCNKAEGFCEYQHYETGIVANAPPRPLAGRLNPAGDSCANKTRESKVQHHHIELKSHGLDDEPESAPTHSFPESSDNQSKHFCVRQSNAQTHARPLDCRQTNVEDEMTLSSLQISTAEPVKSAPIISPVTIESPPPAITCFHLTARAGKTCKFNFLELFARKGKGAGLVDRRAFLIFHPQEHSEELDHMARWLLTQHVEVSNAWYDGSWDNFRQKVLNGGSGVIIMHPDFEYFTELPKFGKVLQKQVRLWAIGVQESLEYETVSSDLLLDSRHDCIEMFPLGGLIYVTEDVFEQKPQQALSIIQIFSKKVEKLRQVARPTAQGQNSRDTDLLWRLCVRPELMEFLLQLCENHAQQLDAHDPEIKSLSEIYLLLSKTNHIEQDDPNLPLSLNPDEYPILSERRAIAEIQPLDYFNTRKYSLENANLHMIRYYAGLQVDMRRVYRHFYVVHTEPWAPCVQRWKKEIQTLADVFTPNKFIQELEKEGPESLIDFCERYTPAHLAGSAEH